MGFMELVWLVLKIVLAFSVCKIILAMVRWFLMVFGYAIVCAKHGFKNEQKKHKWDL
jgi:hypothetical protein